MNFDRIKGWYDMTGRTVLLTGATGRLGQYYCEILSEVGANMVIMDLDQKICDELADGIAERHGTKPMALATDITNKAAVNEAIAAVMERHGRVDVVINNACAEQTTLIDGEIIEFENYPLELWQSNLDVNLTGSFLMSQAAGKHMAEAGEGVILNIGSTYGIVACDQRIYGDTGINSSVGYAATKSGLVNFSRYLASYYQGTKIRVNCISPAGVYNNQGEPFLSNYLDKMMIKRMAELDDLGSAVLYLVSNASRWVTGTNHIVDGGFTAW
jgi:NAD(P)-dependent dehydrogenase (short-subunit alcohol dehydrogenase family)